MSASGQFTIGRLMGVIAGVGIVCGLLMTSGANRFLGLWLIPTLASIAFLGLVIHLLSSPVLGTGCPYCGQATLERRAISSFGYRFYRCSSCGVRCMRVILGGWKDASGPSFEHRYQAREEGDPWTAPPGLDDEDQIASKTHVNLVRSKRNRSPQNPNGPGLE